MSHPLVRLSKLMNWDEIERSFGEHFTSGRGRPALHPRLVAGLQYLQHANDASDARARGRVHLQGQGTHALRVRNEGADRDDVEGKLGGGHAQHGGQSVGWAHAGRNHRASEHPSATPTKCCHRGQRLSGGAGRGRASLAMRPTARGDKGHEGDDCRVASAPNALSAVHGLKTELFRPTIYDTGLAFCNCSIQLRVKTIDLKTSISIHMVIKNSVFKKLARLCAR